MPLTLPTAPVEPTKVHLSVDQNTGMTTLTVDYRWFVDGVPVNRRVTKTFQPGYEPNDMWNAIFADMDAGWQAEKPE